MEEKTEAATLGVTTASACAATGTVVGSEKKLSWSAEKAWCCCCGMKAGGPDDQPGTLVGGGTGTGVLPVAGVVKADGVLSGAAPSDW